jgi:anti-sigma B factor antagonist
LLTTVAVDAPLSHSRAVAEDRARRAGCTNASGDLELRRDGAVAVLRMSGEIDLAVVHFNGVLDDLNALPPDTLEVDLSEVTFIDSSGVGLLVKLHRVVGGGMRLRCPSVPVMRVLRICGLVDVFELDSPRGSPDHDGG